MADQNKGVPFFRKLDCLDVNLSDQGTRGVDHTQSAGLASFANFGRDAVGAINHTLAIGNLINAVDEDRPFPLELLYHEAVMDDFFADVDRRPKRLQGDADDINGPDDPSAKATRLKQQQCFAFRHSVFHSLWMLSRVHVPYYAYI